MGIIEQQLIERMSGATIPCAVVTVKGKGGAGLLPSRQ
jgi:hypothetical protein